MRQTEFFMNACDPKTLTVGQLMQDAVVRCTPRTDALTITHMMTHRNFGSLPVVEEDGSLAGIVTEYDLLQAMIDGRDLRKVLATEIMSAHPVTVTEDKTLVQVADLFQDLQPVDIGQVPVQQVKIEGLTGKRAPKLVPAIEVVADVARFFQPLANQDRLVGVVLEIRDAHEPLRQRRAAELPRHRSGRGAARASCVPLRHCAS